MWLKLPTPVTRPAGAGPGGGFCAGTRGASDSAIQTATAAARFKDISYTPPFEPEPLYRGRAPAFECSVDFLWYAPGHVLHGAGGSARFDRTDALGSFRRN